MNGLRIVRAVLARDLLTEWRRKETVTTIVLFALLTVVTFVFSMDPARHDRADVLPAMLWTAFFFAGMLGLNRSAARDSGDGTLLGIVLSPVDRGWLYVGKLLSHAAFMLIGEAVVLLFTILWFDLDGRHLTPAFFSLLLLGTLGFLSVGNVFAVVGQKSKLREVMLPVLLLPVLSPLILGVAEATTLVLSEGSSEDLAQWIRLVVGFDILFLTVGFLVYGYVLED